jgi:hypothetical protein
MKDLVEYIYNEAPAEWDGEFMALDDDIKDAAVLRYLTTNGNRHLEDIFPVCIDGAYDRMIKELYTSPKTFQLIYIALCKGHTVAECFESEACWAGDATTAQDLLDSPCTAFADYWKHMVYRYVEDNIRQGCIDNFDTVAGEYQS